MAKHALLSASGAHRWLLCTPSAQLEQKFPASTSAYAEEGTVAHALAELTTRYFLGELDEVSYENQIKSEFEPNSYYNTEMRECAVAYAKFVTGRLAEAKKTCPDAMIILETRLDFSKYVPGGFGTGDCVIIAEPILDVIDFKYGKGHRVEAEDNPQMQLYGLGALEQFGDLYEIKTVRMTIFQPRLSGIEDSSEKTVKELTSWGKSYVKPRAKLADKGEGDFAPSEEACRFCRAKNQCRARAEENLKLFDESPDPLLISPEEAGAILAESADIETWLKDLRELVSGALTAGETVTGWKMVEGRSNRKFADEDKVVAAMKAAGYDESLLYDRKLITLTQMERDFGKKTLAEILGDLIVKPQGAPTLAPESDKRPAYRFEDQVLKAFDEYEEEMTMTQSKSRRLLYQQARLIRIQWAVILALVCTIVLMAIFLPKAKAIEETATPTLELEPASYVTPEIMPEPTIETEPEEIEPVLEELGEFRLTAYCACRKCCGKDPGDFGYGVTASGAVVEAGRTIAVDSSVIPLGSEIVIGGHTYVAEDTGSAIKGNRIDIYFDTHQEALNFGVQYADVYIIKN